MTQQELATWLRTTLDQLSTEYPPPWNDAVPESKISNEEGVMSGPIAISYQYQGRAVMGGGYDEGELASLLPAIRDELGPDCPVDVIADGLAEVRERLPAGARVRANSRGYWKRGLGTVVESEVESYARWPESGTSAHFLSTDGPSVCVEFDGDGYSGWWRESWIERVG
jgi:hypothetical protein